MLPSSLVLRRVALAAMLAHPLSACGESSRGDDDDDFVAGDDDDDLVAGDDDDDDDDDDFDAGPVDPSVSGLDERPLNETCLAPARPETSTVRLRIPLAFRELPRLTRPLFLLQAPGNADRFWLIEQPGRVRTFTGDGSDATTALDIEDEVDDRPNEAGLLGIAFHPDFADNGEVFLSYTDQFEGNLNSVVSRFRTSDGGLSFDPESEEVVFRTRQPAGNHNGGAILFGPDGYLYVSLGDGGGANDTFNNGQNPNTLLGTILRIDVDVEDGYAIPADNPFVEGGGAPEVYAWGLRNTWRMSFDRGTGTLWAGDVGQNSLEEIDIIEAGGNYGWPIREGNTCFRSPSCDDAGLIDPVAVYGRRDGVSVTGGYVYRGAAVPELEGVYLYADFGSGQMWGLFEEPATGALSPTPLLETGLNVASFAEDHDGELYLLGLDGTIRQIVSAGEDPPADPFPGRLSETGCMDPVDLREPGPGLIPYEPTATLWSDDAEKRRWMALPEGEQVGLTDDGDFDFPVGTVLVKSFELDGRMVETRFFIRHDDGDWGGYSYAWNEEQTEAFLLQSGERRELGDDVVWTYPSRSQCMACHTEAAGRSLGLELAQLDADLTYPATGRTANQVDTLEAIGVFDEAVPDVADRRPSLSPYAGGDATAAARARSYLHANCSACHRPDGPGRGEQDFRFEASRTDAGCGVAPIHGRLGLGEAARLVAPGDPDASIVLERMRRLDVHRMPPLATEVVDAQGTALVEDWIAALGGCD